MNSSSRELANAYSAVSNEAASYDSAKRDLETRAVSLRDSVRRALAIEGADQDFIQSMVSVPLNELGV